MKLLLIGATGPTGRQIVDQALAQGHTVTALVRDPARASFAPPVTRAVGDVLDAASLTKAVGGQEAVLCSLGSGPTGPFKEMTMLSEGTRHLVATMQQAGTPRLV